MQGEVQNQLNRNSLKGCSKALVIDPELETWLWQDQAAIVGVLEVEEEKLTEWLNQWHRARVPNETLETLVQRYPKEALEQICRRAGEKPTAALYARIASLANLDLYRRESSFHQMWRTLGRWFASRKTGT